MTRANTFGLERIVVWILAEVGPTRRTKVDACIGDVNGTRPRVNREGRTGKDFLTQRDQNVLHVLVRGGRVS